jgi:uncharacterized protein
MIIDQRVVIQAPVDRVWDFTEDIPALGRCLPGIQSVERVDDETYLGGIKVKVGPIQVNLEGKIHIAELNRDALRARMDVEAADKRIRGAVNAKSTIQLESLPDGTTAAAIHTDAAILGKLGEFGQAVMKKKANQIIEQFARNVSTAIAEQEAKRG